ncbi:QRIC2 protein, partial [Menura novaehollandiae]|nr:QRIC2 protein [Menura novaehollandiae]
RHCPSSPVEAKPAPAPISLARSMLQETKRELQKMEEQQEMRNTMLEKLVTETANQLNEQVRSWGSTPTTRQLSGVEEQEKAKAECSNCTFDINVLLGELLQRCEKLQEQVDSLESRHMAVGKLEKLMRQKSQQDQELRQHMEATVVQMQGHYEKLGFISGSLQKDSQQMQKAIEV